MPATPLSPAAEASIKTLREALSHPGAKLGNLARRIESAARDLQEGIQQWGTTTTKRMVLGHEIETVIDTSITVSVKVVMRESDHEVVRCIPIELGTREPIINSFHQFPAFVPNLGEDVRLCESPNLPPLRVVRVRSSPAPFPLPRDGNLPGDLLVFVHGDNEDGADEGWTDEVPPSYAGQTAWCITVEDVPSSDAIVTHDTVPGDF